MKGLAALAVVCAAGLGVFAQSAIGASGYETAAAHERFLRTADHGAGLWVEIGNVRVGPVTAAACRGDGEPLPGVAGPQQFARFVCAMRMANAKKLLIVRSFVDGRVDHLAWR